MADNKVIKEASTKQTADKYNELAAGKIRTLSWYALNYTDDRELIKMLI